MLESDKYYKSIHSDSMVIHVFDGVSVESNNIEYPMGFSNYYIDDTQWIEITKKEYEEGFSF